MPVKLIAFDLDGTLLDERKNIPEENMQALSAAAEAGTLLVPATAVYQIGETGKAVATDVALTTIHRPTVMGLSSADWFLVGWASVVLILTVAVLLVLIRRDEEKGN